VTSVARTPDGSPPSPEALVKAQKIVEDRVHDLEGSGAEAVVDGSNVIATLPLVTCSQDHKQVYLLSKSIISGEQIASASSGLNQQSGENIVDVEFKSDAANIWADFTAANIGTHTAFVLDSRG
jgi:preprotein translocase subunit SecD